MGITTQYVRLSDLDIVSHYHIQKTEQRYKAVPFDADDLLAMGYAELIEPAQEGYRATGKAAKVGNTYQREYVDQTPEEAAQQRMNDMRATDEKMSRIAEDLLDALIAKGVITMSDLPQVAQDIIADRKAKRAAL